MAGIPLFSTLRELKLPMPRAVLQVGASYGQEMSEFLENGIQAGVFIEPLPEPFAHVAGMCRQLPNFVAINTLCADVPGRKFQFNVASNGGMSSSILKPDRHLTINEGVRFEHTTELVSSTLDQVTAHLSANGHAHVVEALDLLFMDCQGAEYKILLGANAVLPQIKYIYTETMRGDLYAGQVPFLNYCAHLDAIGFTLNNLQFDHPAHAGTALFIRKDVVGLKA
jgi:FkbM family methyltransferase